MNPPGFRGPLSRRRLLQLAAPSVAAASLAPAATARAAETELPAAILALKPRLDGVAPIGLEERRARLTRAQRLIAQHGLDALVMASGTSLTYFTGAEWSLSERFFGAVLRREGEPAWVVPAFEKARGLEQIRLGSDVRTWEEDESPFALVAG
ncbi:MAG TPA: aminopeptidase P family N-terminal domain-containing protein, partial [Vicinamibacteria bacterium]